MNSEVSNPSNVSSKYNALLQNEIHARSQGVVMTKRCAENASAIDRKKFLEAYNGLETLSLATYQAFARATGFNYKAPLFNGLRTRFMTFGLNLSTKSSAAGMAKYSQAYVDGSLNKLKELSDPAHASFFDYVLAQELIQVKAFTATEGGKWEAGEKILRDFVQEKSQRYGSQFKL